MNDLQMKTSVAGISQIRNLKNSLEFSFLERFSKNILIKLPILGCLILRSAILENVIILNNKGEKSRINDLQMKTSVAGINQITNLKSSLEFSHLECFGEIISIELPILGCLILRSANYRHAIILNNKGEEARMKESNQMNLALNSLLKAYTNALSSGLTTKFQTKGHTMQKNIELFVTTSEFELVEKEYVYKFTIDSSKVDWFKKNLESLEGSDDIYNFFGKSGVEHEQISAKEVEFIECNREDTCITRIEIVS